MMSFEEIVPNERLRHARDLKGWTQADLAEALGTDFETVSRWERGITVPSSYYREKLCSALGKTPEELGLRSERVDLLDLLTASTLPYVFLASSFADAELEFVTRVKADLQAREITVLSSRAVKRQGGGYARKALQEALRAAQVVLVVVSPAARSSRHVQEALQLAKIYRRPTIAIWIAGESWQACMPKYSCTPSTTIDGRKGYDPSLLNKIVAELERVELAPGIPNPSFTTLNGVFESLTQPRNPYKGLQAFRREDAQDFFGRELLIDKLAASLEASVLPERQADQSARILAVVGPSGSGKSSVVMAGLLSRLQSGGLPGSEEWIYLDPIVPGMHPVESLVLAFAEKLPHISLHTIRGDLEDESAEGLHMLATILAGWQRSRVMLVVDQFEELFTLTTSEQERQHFLALLLNAVSEAHSPVVVVLILRADFFDRTMYYSELGQLIEDHQVLVFAMDINALRAVIEQPAALPDVQLAFEDDLVGDLLFEMQGQSGALPLLQFTLDQLYQRRSGHTLTLRAYHEIGGVKGALVKHAEATYAALPSEEHRRLARALFVRLIDPGMTDQDSLRRRAALTEFVLDDPSQTRLLQETIDAFVAVRLLTIATRTGFATVEISHEALLREWPRLSDWLHMAREDIRLQRMISEDAAEWEQHEESSDRLYRGSQLKEAQAWARRNFPSKKEAIFLRAGAIQRLRFLLSAMLVLLLLLSTTSVAGWILLHQPQLPNPTRVTTLADSGPGSLRWAIENAPTGSTITFAPGLRGTILLTDGDLQFVRNLTLRGPGADVLTISGGEEGYVVHVAHDVSVSIAGLAFKDSRFRGNAPSFITNDGKLILSKSIVSDNWFYSNGPLNFEKGGGAIYNAGTLSLIDSTVSKNESGSSGGGIYNAGTLSLIDSTVSGNTANGGGGGIFNISSNPSNSVSLIDSTVSGNTTSGSGGGILNFTGMLTLTNSTVSNNMAGSHGGGIYSMGALTLTNSTVSGNMAQDSQYVFSPQTSGGGGIYSSGTLILTNTTVAYNTAQSSGGGIYKVGNQGELTFCTIYGNRATRGGGIAIEKGFDDNGNQTIPGVIRITNSIVAANSSAMSPDIAGQLITGGYNLIQNLAGAAVADPDHKHSTDLSGITLAGVLIDSGLRNKGGYTQTLALLMGSPARDSIPLNACLMDGINTDQRGMLRPDDGETECDMGAYESRD